MTTMEMTSAPASSHSFLRSGGAIVAGFASIAVLSTVADGTLHAAGLYRMDGTIMPDGLFALALGYRAAFGVLAGYIAGRLAPNHPARHAVILGAIGTLLSIGGAIALWDAGPHWYAIGVALICIPTAWLGARFDRRRASRR